MPQQMEVFMNFDSGLIDQALNFLPYPIDKNKLIGMARQFGANDQIIGILDKLPDKTFNNAQEVKDALGGLGNPGGFFKP